MKCPTFLAGLCLLALGTDGAAQQTLLLRSPAVSANHIAFVYAGDLWVADRDGSNPRRLTAHPAGEGEPEFSPDGSMLAFAGDYDGNRDVYVIAVDGGQPRRLTWHPGADTPTGWTADGQAVTVVSDRETDHGRSGQLFHASLAGGLPAKRMAARFYRGRYNGDDSKLAYIPFGSGYNGIFGGSSGWKGYRGGTTPAVLVMDFGSNSVTNIPGDGATNFDPFFLGDTVYFISDRDNELFNVYGWDPQTGTTRRVSAETTWEVRAADGHGSSIVYEAGGRLKEIDLDSGETTEIVVSIDPDLPQLRSQWKNVGSTLQAAGISPNGMRTVITARGEVFTVPVDDGSTRNLSVSDGVREYDGLWSPGGSEIAWIVESADGQSLVIADQTGMGDRRSFELGPHFYSLLDWSSGDAGRIAFHDNHLTLYAIDTASGDIERLAENARREGFEAAFSPDGRWLAYTRERPNYHRQLVLHDFSTGSDHIATAGDADASAPAFSPDGQYLYFAASVNSGPLQYGLNMTSQERPYRAGLYALVLAGDGVSPLYPKTADEDGSEQSEDDDDGDEEDDSTPVETRIDVDGLDQRVVALPVAEASYSGLSVDAEGRLYYLDLLQPGVVNTPPGERSAERNRLMRYDFEEREGEEMLDGVTAFSISAAGSHLLISRADGSLAVSDIGEELEPEAVALDGLRIRIDPREEWLQIFDEAWRMEKEFFYDPNMHGLDWDAVYARYRPLLDHVGRREDLSALIVEMIAEMQAGHNRTGGGDTYGESGARTGLLGANFEIENGRYRFEKIYSGEAWNPFIDAPLSTPGNEARTGDYLLAINGRELTAADNVFELLQGTAGEQVSLRVGPSANGRDARDIVVTPVESEGDLRLWAWVEENRRQVAESTDGRVGYVYLPNTAGAGYAFFNRMYFAQVDKEAMIIDERSNSGGQAANYIVEVLSRRHLSGWKDRDGLINRTPAAAMHGPKLMMIDQDAGSGGDYLPYAFRHLGIGKLLGTRTWGGLIGISANPSLIDGGSLVVPYFRFFDTDNAWSIENEGVAPDIEVRLDPVMSNVGRDSQLERAIAEILDELEGYENPAPTEAPPYPTEPGE